MGTEHSEKRGLRRTIRLTMHKINIFFFVLFGGTKKTPTEKGKKIK